MNQRRILIGSMIGVLMFTLMTFINNNTWSAFENQLIQGRSVFQIFDKDPNFVSVEFNENSKYDLFATSTEDQKLNLLNLISEISLGNPDAIYLLIKNDNPLMLDKSNLEENSNNPLSKLEIVKLNEVETNIRDDHGRNLILEQKSYPTEIISAEKISSGNYDVKSLKGKNVLLISPDLKIEKYQRNELINFLSNKWLAFIKIPSLALLALCIITGILFAALVHWARIIAFIAITATVLVIGQITFTFLNTQIETIPFIASLVGILLITNLFDLNLAAIYRKEIFQDQNTKPSKSISQKSIPEIINEQSKRKEEKITSPELLKELRAKFFHEQEYNLEDIALAFEEKTVKSINNIQDKFEELLESNELNERDRIKVDIIKHNFNHMIQEIDAILFNLVPFRFEGNAGLINLLELYAGKTFTLSKGKVQIQIETDIASIKLEIGQKINSYRTLQKLLELIKENNEDKIIHGLNIGIDIVSEADGMIRFKISYEGRAINTSSNSYKLKEIYKRLDGLPEASLDLGDTLTGTSTNLTNHIIFKIKNPSFNLLETSIA